MISSLQVQGMNLVQLTDVGKELDWAQKMSLKHETYLEQEVNLFEALNLM